MRWLTHNFLKNWVGLEWVGFGFGLGLVFKKIMGQSTHFLYTPAGDLNRQFLRGFRLFSIIFNEFYVAVFLAKKNEFPLRNYRFNPPADFIKKCGGGPMIFVKKTDIKIRILKRQVLRGFGYFFLIFDELYVVVLLVPKKNEFRLETIDLTHLLIL